ncbi:MAG: ComF family protein [Gammaproteobacteria bacterium]|nr:ComF family protein [Gammaproteobacteria bacterium]
MLKKCIDWLLPINCIVCGFTHNDFFCSDCLAELPWLKGYCYTCGTELPSETWAQQCGECLINPPPFERALILFSYRFPIPSLITQLKFQKKLRLAYPIGVLLAKKILEQYNAHNLTLPECIIPVPLHISRLRTRGYNQSVEIARPLKKLLDLPVDFLCVRRTRSTAPQSLLEIKDRQRNIKNVFQVTKPLPYRHVAILDDVITTAGTVSELAKVLKKAGVATIEVWCIARTELVRKG